MVSDWSGITIEYSILTLRKSIVFNTNKKILNSDFNNLKYVPFEFQYRNQLSYEISLNNYELYEENLKNINAKKDANANDILKIKNDLFY